MKKFLGKPPPNLHQRENFISAQRSSSFDPTKANNPNLKKESLPAAYNRQDILPQKFPGAKINPKFLG